MGLDYKQFNKLFEQNEALQKRNKQFVEKLLNNMALTILNRTAYRTPVDTGALRASWDLSEITWFNTFAQINLINNTEYASFVEYGHRTVSGGWVEGVFMAKISIEEVKAQFEKMYDQLFLQEFSDVL